MEIRNDFAKVSKNSEYRSENNFIRTSNKKIIL